jgi:hypothetical protein
VRVTGTDRRRAGLDYGQLVRGSGELRRRRHTPANSTGSGNEQRTPATNGNVEQCTGELERWDAWVGGRKERVPAAFYREREVDGWSARERERRRRPSLAINGGVTREKSGRGKEGNGCPFDATITQGRGTARETTVGLLELLASRSVGRGSVSSSGAAWARVRAASGAGQSARHRGGSRRARWGRSGGGARLARRRGDARGKGGSRRARGRERERAA